MSPCMPRRDHWHARPAAPVRSLTRPDARVCLRTRTWAYGAGARASVGVTLTNFSTKIWPAHLSTLVLTLAIPATSLEEPIIPRPERSFVHITLLDIVFPSHCYFDKVFVGRTRGSQVRNLAVSEVFLGRHRHAHAGHQRYR